MKTCPVCQAVAFDDAVTCFGCLHTFANDEEALVVSSEVAPSEVPPSFLIQIKPERERSGLTSWSCTVDLVPA